jgi:hypothetical protein
VFTYLCTKVYTHLYVLLGCLNSLLPTQRNTEHRWTTNLYVIVNKGTAHLELPVVFVYLKPLLLARSQHAPGRSSGRSSPPRFSVVFLGPRSSAESVPSVHVALRLSQLSQRGQTSAQTVSTSPAAHSQQAAFLHLALFTVQRFTFLPANRTRRTSGQCPETCSAPDFSRLLRCAVTMPSVMPGTAPHLPPPVFSLFLVWFRRLGANVSARRPGFDPTSVRVGFVMDKVALGQDFFCVLRFSPVSIIPPVLHTHTYVHVVLIRRTNGRSVGPFKKQCSFGNRGALNRRVRGLSLCGVLGHGVLSVSQLVCDCFCNKHNLRVLLARLISQAHRRQAV